MDQNLLHGIREALIAAFEETFVEYIEYSKKGNCTHLTLEDVPVSAERVHGLSRGQGVEARVRLLPQVSVEACVGEAVRRGRRYYYRWVEGESEERGEGKKRWGEGEKKGEKREGARKGGKEGGWEGEDHGEGVKVEGSEEGVSEGLAQRREREEGGGGKQRGHWVIDHSVPPSYYGHDLGFLLRSFNSRPFYSRWLRTLPKLPFTLGARTANLAEYSDPRDALVSGFQSFRSIVSSSFDVFVAGVVLIPLLLFVLFMMGAMVPFVALGVVLFVGHFVWGSLMYRWG